MSCRRCITLAVVVLLAQWAVAELRVEIVWTIDGAGAFSAPNALMNAETGRTQALVAAECDTGIVCVGLDGTRLWTYPMEPPVTSPPAVADIDGDGNEEIIAADSKGNVAVLNGEGRLVWSAETGAGVVTESCPAAVDLDGDGQPEILVGDTSGTVTCFNHTGRLLWQFTGDGTQMGPVLAADIYDEPGKEVVVTSHDRHVYVLTSRGEWIWDLYFEKDLFPNSTPVLADVDADGVPELYLGGGLNHFYRIDLVERRVAFELNTYMHVNNAINGTDLDGDGGDELVFGMKGGALCCYGADGVRWSREFRKSGFHGGPCVVNLDDDPALEMICYSTCGDVLMLDTDGSTISSTMTACRPAVQPLVGDLDGDGMLELVAADQGPATGKMLFAELGVPYRPDPRDRTVFASNRAHTCRAPHAETYPAIPTPVHTSGPARATASPLEKDLAVLSGTNAWRFDVANPDQSRVTLLTDLSYPDGSVRRFARHVLGPRGRKAASFEVKEAGTYGLVARLADSDTLAVNAILSETLQYRGLKSDEARLSAAFEEIERAAAAWQQSNPRAAANASTELASLRGRLLTLMDQKKSPATPQMASSLRRAAERLRALTEAGATLAPQGSFFAWEVSPWAYFDARDSLPTPEDQTDELRVFLCRDEFESLALNVTNVGERALEVRILCDGIEGGDDLIAAEHVEFRRAVTVPAMRREQIADALPLLDEAGLLSIPSLESQQLWITVNAKGLAPGRYVARMRLKSVEPDPTVIEMPIVMDVQALALPRPRPLRFCTWALDFGGLAIDKDYVLEDLVEHGNTIFLAKGPKAECNADGELIGDIDFTDHDRSVKRYSPHGMVLFMGGHGGLGGQPVLSEPWKKAFVPFMRAWAAHLSELGLDYRDWAMYPIDEPSSPFMEHTIQLVEIATLIREADPNILIYADPTNGTTEKSLEMYKHLVDIWCPSNQLLDRFGEEVLAVARAEGEEVWNYDARGRAKTLSTLGHYRWWLWNVWNLGFTGAGWFCYAHHGDADRWDGPNNVGSFFAVYDGPGAVVTSKRWEVTREAIEDYEYLYLLREALRDAEKRGVAESKLAAARKLLEELPPRIESTLRSTSERIPLTPDSAPLYEEATRLLDEARRSIVETCLDLRS